MAVYELDFSETESNDSWLKASRLLEDGSEASLKEFNRMEKEEMVKIEWLEEEGEEK